MVLQIIVNFAVFVAAFNPGHYSTSPGGLDATIVEKMSEDVQQGFVSERKKGGIYCVAGTVNSISSKNGCYNPNVSVQKCMGKACS